MKQITVPFRTILLMVVLVSLAACSGGIFVDPGHGGAGGGSYSDGDFEGSGSTGSGSSTGGGSGSGAKPARLSSTASYDEALAKLDEIIDYCEEHPGTGNNMVKSAAETTRDGISLNGQSNWSSLASSMIPSINTFIGQLQ
jgi:hypothetical protein